LSGEQSERGFGVRLCLIRMADMEHRCLHHGSLDRYRIGDDGVRDLGAALRVNTTLTELE
jgi:hypothetical protein